MFKSLSRYLKKQKKKRAVERKKKLVRRRKEEKRERDKMRREEKREREKDKREEKKIRELEKKEKQEQSKLDRIDRQEEQDELREIKSRKKYEFKEEKRKRKLLSTILPIIVFIVIIILGISYINNNYTKIDNTNKENPTSKALYIRIDGNSILKEGQTITLKAYVTSELQNEKANWKSDNKEIADVNSLGVVTAKKEGTTFISAYTDNGVSAKKKIIVESAETKKEKVNVLCNISIMKVKDIKQLNIKRQNSDKKLTFTSSDSNIATISSTGRITARKKGKVIITVNADNKQLTACNIEIIN